MNSYLYTWNPNRWDWIDLKDATQKINGGKSYEIYWSCGGTKRINVGDQFFLLRLGAEPKGIIGYGTILSQPYALPHWDKSKAEEGKVSLRTNLKFLALSESPLLPLSYLQDKYPAYNWTPQSSGLSIPPDISVDLLSSLNETADNIEGATSWSKEELQATVDAYLEIREKIRNKQPANKAAYYKALSEKFNRSAKAFEYRMQNISYVLSLMGAEWILGLKPARNVGANVAAELEQMLVNAEGKKHIPIAAFEIDVFDKLKKKSLSKPSGSKHPRSSITEITNYQRDSSVKAWVLKEANGTCECCVKPAPFVGYNGMPFLEVHHIRKLAENGSDTISNAIAVCPNCHRELHHGENAMKLMEILYGRISRLIKE